MFNHKDMLDQPINHGDMIVYSNSRSCSLHTTMVSAMTPKRVNGCDPKEVVVITDKYKTNNPQGYAELLKSRQEEIDKDKSKKHSKAPKKTYHITVGWYYDVAKGRSDRSQPMQDIYVAVSVYHNSVLQGSVTRPRGTATNYNERSLVRQYQKKASGYGTEATGKIHTGKYNWHTDAELMLAGKHVKGLIGGLPEESTVVPFDSLADIIGNGSVIGMTVKELEDALF